VKTSDIPAEPPRLTAWWRVGWLVLALAVLCVVLACLLGVSSRNEGRVAASFLGYDLLDEGSEQLALIRLTNSSTRSFWCITGGEIASNGASVVVCLYRAETKGVWNEWNEPAPPPKSTTLFSLAPGGSDLVAARISRKVKNSQIGVLCLEKRANWPEPLQSLPRLWCKVVPPNANSVRASINVALPPPITDPQ